MRNSQHSGNAVDNIDLQHVLENFRTRIEIVRQYVTFALACYLLLISRKYQLHMLPIPSALDYWKTLVDPNEFVLESIFSSFSKDLLVSFHLISLLITHDQEYKLPALKEGVEERGLKKILAEITSPKCNIDNPLAFLTFLPIKLCIEGMKKLFLSFCLMSIGTVFGSSMLMNKLMLRVQLPNNSAQFYPIPTSHFKPLKSFNFFVSTTVVVRHYDWGMWTLHIYALTTRTRRKIGIADFICSPYRLRHSLAGLLLCKFLLK